MTGHTCVVCGNSKANVTFHRIPKDAVKTVRWLEVFDIREGSFSIPYLVAGVENFFGWMILISGDVSTRLDNTCPKIDAVILYQRTSNQSGERRCWRVYFWAFSGLTWRLLTNALTNYLYWEWKEIFVAQLMTGRNGYPAIEKLQVVTSNFVQKVW